MERDLYCRRTSNPEDAVFENLQWTRVEIKLEDSDRQTAIALIEDHIKGIENDDYKAHVLFLIAIAIQLELFKSKEIDVETIQQLAAFYPLCVEVDDDPKDDNMRWLPEYDNFKLSPDEDDEDEDEDEDEDKEKEIRSMLIFASRHCVKI